MRQGWEAEAQNWVSFARVPGNDRSHEHINLPVLLDLVAAHPVVPAPAGSRGGMTALAPT